MAWVNEAEALSLDSTDHHPASFIWRCSEESCMLGQSHTEITCVHRMPQGLHKAEWIPLHPSCPFSKSSQSAVLSKALLPMGKQSAGLFSDNPSHHVIPQRTCSLFSPGSCLSPPAPASFFNGAYISLLGLPQLNIQTRRFKPRTFVFPQFRRLEVQDQGMGRFSFFCGPSPWPAEGHFSLCSHTVFLLCSYVTHWCFYVSTCFPLIETPVRLGRPTLTASF